MSKISFLYWNIGRQSIPDLISLIAREHDVQIIMLSECRIQPTELLVALNAGQSSLFSFVEPISRHVSILSSLPAGSLEPIGDPPRLTIRKLKPPFGQDVLLAVGHLPSKLHNTREDQAFTCVDVIRRIQEAESRTGHTRTIFCGDFNMDPWEFGMIGAQGIHAMLSRKIAVKESRKVGAEVHRFFYNPMWGLLGDTSEGPPGTFYYNSSSAISYYWHMFDQVLLRPSLLPHFDSADLRILVKAGERDLVDAEGRPNKRIASDHLPLIFRMDL